MEYLKLSIIKFLLIEYLKLSIIKFFLWYIVYNECLMYKKLFTKSLKL